MAVVWYVSLTPHPPDVSQAVWGDKWGHMLAYLALMFWFGQLYPRDKLQRLALLFIIMGVAIEFVQKATGYRSFEIADMLADAVGVLLASFMTARIALFAQLERFFDLKR